MKKYKLLLSTLLMLLVLSCEESSDTDDSSGSIAIEGIAKKSRSKDDLSVANKDFNTGGGLGGYVIHFRNDGTFETFSFCDICSGSGSIGTYVQKSNAIYMLDSLCYVNEPHFTDSSVFVDCKYSTMTTYYIIGKMDGLYLSSDPKDTLFPGDAKVDFSYPSYQFSKSSI